MEELIKPLPEIIGGDWEVRRSTEANIAYIDYTKKQFVVPYDDDDHSEFLRAHENMHVKITPTGTTPQYKGVEVRTMQAVEDARINAELRRIGIVTNAQPNVPQESPIDKPDELEAARSLAAFYGRYEYDDVLEDASALGNPKIIEAANYITDYFDKEPRSFDDVKRAAKWLTDIDWNRPLDPPDFSQGETPEASEDENGEGEGEGNGEGEGDEQGEGMSAAMESAEDSAKPFMRDVKTKTQIKDMTQTELDDIVKAGFPLGHVPMFDNSGSNADPGVMYVKNPALELPLKRPKSIGKRASDTGDVPVNFHRMTTDMRVFKSRAMAREGIAALIDWSGSMRLQAEDVLEIIEAIPAAIIAVYGGDGKEGDLVVVANHKRMVRNIQEWGYDYYHKTDGVGERKRIQGENTIDVPALEWLSKRKERKKIWVSDGHMTGMAHQGYQMKPRHWRDAADIVKRAEIIRMNDIGVLKKAIKERKV